MQVDQSCKILAQILHMEILQDHSSRFEPHVQVSCKTLQECCKSHWSTRDSIQCL